MGKKSLHLIFFVIVFLLISPFKMYAAGVYVRDWITISIRNAPSENAKSIGLANTNDYLEVLEEQDEWKRVRTQGGKEGWVQDRYVSPQTPKTLIIDQLNEKIQSLSAANKTLQEENKQLTKENRENILKLNNLTKESDKIKKDYDSIQGSSSDYVVLKKNHEKLQTEFKTASDKLDLVSKENSRLKTSERLVSILLGGGFIIFGILIGILLQLQRGKPKKTGYKL